MKIGYFVTLFPYPESFQDGGFCGSYPVGGAEIAAYHLARSVADLGHEVTVFATSVDSETSVKVCNGTTVCHFSKSFGIEKAFFSFQEFLKSTEHDVDIVHVHFTTPPGNLAGWYYARARRKPLVVTYHGDAVPDYGRLIRRIGLRLFDWFFVDRILDRAAFIISPSEYYIDESRFLPRYRQKIVTIPNGISLEELAIPCTKRDCRKRLSLREESRIVLFVGALISYKSPDLLIRALPLVVEKVPEARLVLVGDGPMRQQLANLAEKLKVADRVKFAGPVAGIDKSLYYKAADVFALPSTLNTEVFPLVLLEASAVRLPMVVSSLNTFRCLIEDGFNGVVTRTGDPGALAEAIATLLSQPALRRQMGENARSKIEDHSYEKIAELTERVYRTAVK